MKNCRSFLASASGALAIWPIWVVCAALALNSCSDDRKSSEGANGGSADSTGNAGSGESGKAGTGNGTGGTGGATGTGGSRNEGGGAAVPIVPDAAKDCGAASGGDVPALKLTPIADGFTRPIFVTQPRGETERLFVVEKPGTIKILRGGTVAATPFLDIPDEVSEQDEEMGLLGLAFHPDYASNGKFYVYYANLTNDVSTRRLVEYQRSAENPDVADPGSARPLLAFDHPQGNHNGGNLAFGSDGFLYLGVGDGGGANDEHGSTGNGQNLGTYLGKMLRFDVNGSGAGPNQAYAIPAGNMAGNGTLPEIWSYGLRNPWRYSFDACTGDLYIGDVGQDTIEEVDFEPAQNGGRNYGWRLMEAQNCFNPKTGCNAATQNLILPVASYDHSVGQSITGGYVYRGHAIPGLRGTYLYTDYENGRFFALRMSNGTVALQQTEITDNINPGGVKRIGSFGQDEAGELYVVNFDGALYRIDPK
jgi:glucose/arabinose dehydrogenase